MIPIKDIKQNNPFKVPANYFDEANTKIIAATSGKVPNGEKRSAYLRLRPILMAAASVAALALITVLSIKVITSLYDKKMLAGELQSESQEILYADIDILMLEESAADLSFDSEVPEVSHEEIVEYLLLENIDITDIFENY